MMYGRTQATFSPRLGWPAAAILVALVSTLALLPSPTCASPAAATTTADPVGRCEDAVRSAKRPLDLASAFAELFTKPRCRAAFLTTSHPESYVQRVLEGCARDYCPELPEPRPAACAALTTDGIHVDSARRTSALLRELGPAIITFEHGVAAQARLARTARRSALGVRARALDIGLALCEPVAGPTLGTALGDAVSLAPGMVERLAALRAPDTSCAVREDTSSDSEPDRAILVLATLTGTQALPIDRLLVELHYQPQADSFDVVSVTIASRETPEDAPLAYHTLSDSLVIVSGRDPGSLEERTRTPDDRLRVEIRSDGISLYAGRRPVGPGCAIDVEGTTFKNSRGGEDDLEALRSCAERLRSEVPALRSAQEMDVCAGREVVFRRVTRVLRALRADAEGRPLFTKMNFAVLH